MNKEMETLSHDMGLLAEDARALVAATAGIAGERVVEARKRLVAGLERGKKACGELREEAVEEVKVAGQALREHPYPSLGVALGFGALIGYIIARRSQAALVTE